jgi:YD repeat-containing protein
LLTTNGYDFKGNPLSITKQVAEDYKNLLDWSAEIPPTLEAEVYTAATEYDALNRPLKSIAPDGSETLYTYNEANFLETVSLITVNGSVKPIITNIDYDAKGQRTKIKYGNGKNDGLFL